MELLSMIMSENWSEAIIRITLFPHEVHHWNNGSLPIHKVCYRANTPIFVIKALYKAYPQGLQEYTKSKGELPLHIAVNAWSSPNIEIVKFLLKRFNDGTSKRDDYGNLPLHSHLLFSLSPLFTYNLSLHIIKLLVGSYPESVKMINHQGQRHPLHLAVAKGCWEVTKYLLNLYPEALLKKDYNCMTPSKVAKNNKHAIMENQLLLEEIKRFGKKHFMELIEEGNGEE